MRITTKKRDLNAICDCAEFNFGTQRFRSIFRYGNSLPHIALSKEPVIILILSATATSFGSGSSPGAGNSRNHDTVAEIKEKVHTNVSKVVRGASALSILHSARDQVVHGKTREDQGDISGALHCLLTAAQLSKRVYEHAEFRQEKDGKKGAVWREMTEFQKVFPLMNLSIISLI